MIETASETEFEQLMKKAQQIKENTVDQSISWYKKHCRWPFLLFRIAGVSMILLSVSLPAVVVMKEFWKHDYVVAAMSISIASLTGLSSFYKWERTWRSRMLCLQELKQLAAKFDLEIGNARYLLDPSDRMKHVYQATDDMLTNYKVVCAAESESFFSGLQFPQSDRATSNAKIDSSKKS